MQRRQTAVRRARAGLWTAWGTSDADYTRRCVPNQSGRSGAPGRGLRRARLAGRRGARRNDEDGAPGPADDELRDAAHEESIESRSAVRSGDHEVDIAVPRGVEDGARRVSF